jgi:hypothetical protein
MTSKQKAKGYYYETKTVDVLNKIPGCHAKRQLASGAYGKLDERLDGDIVMITNVSCEDCAHYSTGRDENGCKRCGCDVHEEIKGILHCNDFEPMGYRYKVEVKARTKDFPQWIEHALTQGDIVALWKCANGGSKGYILMPIETLAEVIG